MTPRLVILSERLISLPVILMDGITGNARKRVRVRVPNSMNSDLLGLRQRPLCQSQMRRVSKQASKQEIELNRFETGICNAPFEQSAQSSHRIK